MVFEISPVRSADIPTITAIQWAALQSNPLIQTLYPRGATPALAQFTTKSYQKASGFPSVRLIKATDPDSGQIAAFAKWIVFRKDEQPREESQGEELNEKTNEEDVNTGGGWRKEKKVSEPPDCFTRALIDWNDVITRTRRGIMGNRRHSCFSEPTHSLSCYFACYSKNLMVLDIVHTHPAHQGKGAGVQLVRWGTEVADSEGLQCYLESSPTALSLFQFCGFQDITEMGLNLGIYRAGKSEYKHTIMLRPPYGISSVLDAPQTPQKGYERPLPLINIMDHDPSWVDTISEEDEEDEDEGDLEPPTMAEARMLDLRSSSSTGSPKLSSVQDMRTSSSMRNIRASSSLGAVRTSASTRSF